MKITKEGWDKYATIKVTTSNYCQSCSKNFKGVEIVYYAPLDNNIICKKCAEIHNTKEPRLFIEGEY